MDENSSQEKASSSQIDQTQSFDEETYVPLKNEQYREKCETEYKLIKDAGFLFNYECPDFFIKVEPGPSHTVLFDHLCLRDADDFGPPKAHPQSQYIDQYNDDYVKMPFSDCNLDQNGEIKWKDIVKTLDLLARTLSDDPDSIHIEFAIKRINPRYKNTWNFDNLHFLFNEELEGLKGETLLKELLPKMINLAKMLPKKICKPIPILKLGVEHAISLTQEQCACILANSFFCTFPDRCFKTNPSYLPYINFSGFVSKSNNQNEVPDGVVTFKRNHIPNEYIPNFRNSTKPIRKALIQLDGTIEDCTGAVQLDFANKFLGGGVLNHGCVQEEIRFVICPELLVSLLFSECLNSNESMLIRGSQRFSSYTGYGSTFQWDEDFVDQTARDEYRRLYTDVLAIDALKYRYPKLQFGEAKISRELKKCYSGFCCKEDKTSKKVVDSPVLATGNWGCGAFGGDRQLKFLIQLMAASVADRDIIYFTFNHKETVMNLNKIMNVIEKEKLNVGQVYKLIMEYSDEIRDLDSDDLKRFCLSEFLDTKFNS